MSVKTHKVSFKNSFKQGTVLATLLGCSALYLPLDAQAATAKTSWAVSRVASASLGSYCTMAQKYSDDTVLTFAQNTKGEYSLALDFKDKKFTSGKKQSISVAVDGGKTKIFDVVPQTEKTAVLGIGNDTDFINKISSAGQLNVKVGTEASDFKLSEFASGKKEMSICIDALQAPAEAVAAAPAEKTIVSSPKPVIRKNEIAMKSVEPSSGNEPSVEGLLAAMPKPSSDINPLQEDILPVPVKAKADSMAAGATGAAGLQAEVASLRGENARLSRALSEQRKSFEDRQLNADGAAISELREKLEVARAENKSLNDQLGKMESKTSSKENTETLKLSESVRSLQQENQTLKNQIQIYANAKDSKSANTQELAKLQAENADLKQVIAGLKSAPKESATNVASASGDELNKLRADNRKLISELELAKTEKATLQTQAANFQKDLESKQLKMSGGSWDLEQATRRYQESQREIVRLGSIIQSQDVKCANEKKDIEYMLFDPAIATKAQIAMLNSMEDQIKEKDGKLKSAEAELSSAKAQASPDKDAKIANLQKSVAQAEIQLAEKTQLLADAQAKIQKSQVSQADIASKDRDMAALKADLAQKSQQLADAQSRMQQVQLTDKDLAAAKADLAQKSQQLADAQLKIQQAQSTQAELASKNQTLLSLQSDLVLKGQQLAYAQAKLQQANQGQLATVAQKDAELASVKAQLAQTQSQLAIEQANAQKIDVKAQAQQSAEQAAAIASLQLQVQQANQTIIQLQNQISTTNQAALRAASMAAVAPAAAAADVVQANYAPTQTQAVASRAVAPVQAANFKSIEEFSTLLKNAGISVRGALQQVKGGDAATYRAYSWKTDSLYGSAEMRKVSDASQFDAAVNQYLSRAKSRCAGEFAAVPSPVKAAGMAQSKAYEIACVGQGSSSSASVLFTYGNQITTIVAHEGRAEAMDLAIDARDKVSSKIN